MSEEVMRHYRRPFPTIDSRRAVRFFPKLLPIEGRPPESDAFFEDLQRRLQNLKFPALWIRAFPGMLLSHDTEYHLHLLRGRLPQLIIKDFGPGLHYLQEDNPVRIADLIAEWMQQCRLISGETQPGQPKSLKHAA